MYILHCLSTTNTTNYASCLFPCNNSPKKIGLWLFLDFENQFRLMKESHGQHLGIAEAGGGGGLLLGFLCGISANKILTSRYYDDIKRYGVQCLHFETYLLAVMRFLTVFRYSDPPPLVVCKNN